MNSARMRLSSRPSGISETVDGRMDRTFWRGIRTVPSGPGLVISVSEFASPHLSRRNTLGGGLHNVDFVAGHKAGARENDGIEEVMAGADSANSGQVRAHMATLVADGMAFVTGDLFTEKDTTAAAVVAAGV